MAWWNKSMSECEQTISQIKGETTTHNCPSCGRPTYCAMEAGKSPHSCWCFAEEQPDSDDLPLDKSECLCRSCLLKATEAA